jgi:Flp pilus assembly protein TadB
MFGLRFGDWAMLALVVMLAVYMLWTIRARAAAVAKSKQPEVVQAITRQTEIGERQVAVLERIATALEKRN